MTKYAIALKALSEILSIYSYIINKIIFIFTLVICILFHVKTKWLPEQHL